MTGKTFAPYTFKRVQANLDQYQTEWINMRSDVCEARLIRGTQSEELFDLRMNCLQQRIVELKALVKVFSKADFGVLQKAVAASASLTSIALCADEKALRAPYPPPQTAETRRVQQSQRERPGLPGPDGDQRVALVLEPAPYT